MSFPRWQNLKLIIEISCFIVWSEKYSISQVQLRLSSQKRMWKFHCGFNKKGRGEHEEREKKTAMWKEEREKEKENVNKIEKNRERKKERKKMRMYERKSVNEKEGK